MEQQQQFGVIFYMPEGITQIQGFGPPRFIEGMIFPLLGLLLTLAAAAALVFATIGTPQERQGFQAGFAGAMMMGMMMGAAK